MGKSLESVKQEVRSLLITYPRGVSLNEFLRTYKSMLATRLPSREFGFTLDIDFLHSLSDVVHIELDKNGTYQLHALANKDTAHIQKLVKKQRVVKGKSNCKSKGPLTYHRFTEVATPSASTTRCRPFVPAVLRAEIIQVVKQYPDGIGYVPFLMAYQSLFKRAPNLSWLSASQQDKCQQLANAIPELEVKVVNNQEKLRFVSQSSPTERLTNGEISGKFSRLQPLIGVNKDTASSSTFKPQDLNGLMDVSAIPQHVKYNIEKILKKYPEGILAVHFPILYENFTQKTFDLHDLGYNSLLDLVDALPDIFIRVESPESVNDWILFHADFSDSIADARQASAVMNGVPTQNNFRSSPLKERAMAETAPPTLQYIQAELPADSTSRFFPVFISSFINPSLFWFQLQTEEAIANLQKLVKEMEYFYNTQVYNNYKLNDADILIGTTCVAFLSCDNHWYRCVISSLLNTENVKVYLVDYGSWETIPRKNLYYLKYSFILLPAQAFQAQLALVQPANKVGTWETSAQKRFLELCNKSYIMAKVNSMQSHVASLYLCDVCEEGDVYVNDTLVNEGLAEYSPSDESDDSMNDSALSGNLTPAKQFSEKSKVENGIENSAPLHNHLSNGGQTLNLVQTNTLINKLEEFQLSKDRKSVRRILLGDGYQIHILIVEEAAFVSGEDLCNLFWKGRKAEVLASRLEFKEVMIPTLSISKDKYGDLFAQCERYEVGGFSGIDNSYSVTLYPLKYSLKVLNVFGHPSLTIREKLIQEIREFNPRALVWRKSEANGEHYEEVIDVGENNFDRLCVYDLKTMREGLEFKKLKVIACHKKTPDQNFSGKLKDIESMKNSISQRIKELEDICLKYSEETS